MEVTPACMHALRATHACIVFDARLKCTMVTVLFVAKRVNTLVFVPLPLMVSQ